MIVVVPSIPHTGTQFVWNEILGWLQPEIRNPRRSPHGKIWIHTYPDRIAELKTLHSYPWVIPMRHPYSVGMSWKGRLKSLDYLVKLYEIQRDELHPYKPLYLPIDSENRQLFLEKISVRLATNIETAWPNSTSTGYKDTLTEDEMTRLAPFVEHYEHICHS